MLIIREVLRVFCSDWMSTCIVHLNKALSMCISELCINYTLYFQNMSIIHKNILKLKANSTQTK